MKLANAGGICCVCGSDTYGADVGCGCKKFYYAASSEIQKKYEAWKIIYKLRTDYIMRKFESYYSEREKKSKFFDSVLNFWKTKGYVSKNQLNGILEYFFGYDREDIEKAADRIERNFINDFEIEHNDEIVKLARVYFGKAKHLRKLAKA